MRKLNRLLMAALVLLPLAACDEGDDNITPVDEPAVGTVSGAVSVEGSGLAGVTVQLAGATSQSTTTGSDGSYSFANVVEGNYSITLSGIPGDVVFSNTTQSVSIATDGQVATADFNGQFVRTASILVTVARADGSGVVTNVRLQGDDVDQTLGTNAQGNVTFSGLKSGDYTVTLPNPPAEGFDDTPTTQNVSVNTGQAVQVNFIGDTEIVPPEVTIKRITQSGAGVTVPVDPDSIVGRVEVTINVDPKGNDLETVQLWVMQKSTGTVWKIAEQRFASSQPLAQSGDTDTDVTFSWNSDAFRRKDGSHPSIKVLNTSTGEFDAVAADPMRPFHPLFINGDYEVQARVTVAEFDEGFNALVDVTLENQDALNLGVVSDNTDWNDPTTGEPFRNFIIQNSTGLRWLSGDVIVMAYPIIYSQVFDPNNPLLARANFAFDAFVTGTDVGIGGAELTTPNADGSFTFTFCEAGGVTSTAGAACYASINDVNTGLIGARNIVVQTKTQFGQFGPGFNAAAGVNNIKNIEFFNDDLQSGTGVLNDVLRIDNESPVPATVSSYLDHPANAFTGVDGFSRTGLAAVPTDATDVYLGWVGWDDNLSGRVGSSPSDQPFVYPALDKNGNPPTGGVWVGYDLNAAFAPGAPKPGIGNPAGNPHLTYVDASDPDTQGAALAQTVSGVIAGADLSTSDNIDGKDLPPETDSPGLVDAGSADGTPFTDTEFDYAMAARHWDEFGNWTNSANYILFGVDGRAPIFSDAAGTTDPDNSLTLVDPTVAGSKYNTFDDDFYDLDLRGGPDYVTFGNAVWNSTTTGVAPFTVGKAKGAYEGYTTDRGNGFSGVAGVVVKDFEQGCGSGELACFSTTTTRWGQTLQPVVPGGSAIVLGFVFDGQGDVTPAGSDTFEDVSEPGRVPVHTVGTPFRAYVATMDVADSDDGYRDHNMRTYDRAGNVRQDEAPSEGNADHDAPNVGNVQMPTVVTFNLNDPYSFFGENLDQVDLKASDFSFDFNSILSLQLYSSPSALSHPNYVVGSQTPPNDVEGVPFEENSLQLPLENVAHTAFGSQDIYLGGQLGITTEFIGCLLRADEYGPATVTSASTAVVGDADIVGPEPRVHRPRGPRWRTWDHSSAYGLVNTQFNTFVQTSIPTCLTPASIATNFVPALGVVGPGADGIALNGDDGSGPDGIFGNQDDDASWIFNLDASLRPRITFKGQTATFVPNIDPNTDVNMYYLDTSGRARLLDNSNFSLRVSDLGTGAFGRWYEYTLINPLPADLIDPADIPADNGTFGKNGWFFVVKGSAVNGNDGHGVIWDETSNPAGVAAADALPTDGTVTATPGGNMGRFQFTSTANTGYLIQGVGATDLSLRVNPIMNALTVADGEDLGQSEQEFVAYVANGMAATTVSTGPTYVGEVNAQVCTVSSLAVGSATQVTLAAAPADCVIQPGQGGTLAGGTQIEAQMIQVTLAAGSNYTITASTDAGAGDVADPGVILVAPNGEYVTRAWNNTANNNPETINFAVPAGQGGTYLLLVHGAITGGDVGDIRVSVN